MEYQSIHVFSFPLSENTTTGEMKEMRRIEDSIESPWPNECTYIFRRNFGHVFEASYAAVSDEFELHDFEISDFQFSIKAADNYAPQFGLVSFSATISGTDRPKRTELLERPALRRYIEDLTGIKISDIETYEIGYSSISIDELIPGLSLIHI